MRRELRRRASVDAAASAAAPPSRAIARRQSTATSRASATARPRGDPLAAAPLGDGSSAASTRLSGSVEPGRRLAGQHLRCRTDALQLAAEAQQIEIGLEDLLLRPARSSARACASARSLRRHAPRAPRARAAGIEQRGELHGDRAGAAPAPRTQRSAHARRARAPVDAADAARSGGPRRRRPLRRAPARSRRAAVQSKRRTLEVDAHAIEHLAVAIEQVRVGRRPRGAHGGEVRRRCAGATPSRDATEREQREHARTRVAAATAQRDASRLRLHDDSRRSAARRTSPAHTSLRRASPAAGTCRGC